MRSSDEEIYEEHFVFYKTSIYFVVKKLYMFYKSEQKCSKNVQKSAQKSVQKSAQKVAKN